MAQVKYADFGERMIIISDDESLQVEVTGQNKLDQIAESWAKDKVLLEVRTGQLAKAVSALDEIERQWYKPGVYLDTWMIPILNTIKELRNG